MPSKSKEARIEQKEYWENKLKERLTLLAETGLEPSRIATDAAVRKLRATIRTAQSRLKTIEELRKKKEELAQIKAEKLATPKADKNEKKKRKQEAEEQAVSKRQQKKQKKKEAKPQPAEA